MELSSFCSCQDLYWQGCYGSGAKYNKYMVPESVKHPAKMSFELLERIFRHLESHGLLTPCSVVVDFMAGTGRTSTMAALLGYRTISVELEPHFIEMMAGYDCDGKSISDFRIEPCVCGSDTLHKPHKPAGLVEMECSGNPRIVPVCRCGDKIHHKKHHIPGNRELLEQVTGRKVKWDVIQGDARELTKLLDKSELVGVISPPYSEQMDKRHDSPRAREIFNDKNWTTYYSKDPNNIGNLKDTPLVGVVSPPYFSQVAYQDKEFIIATAEDKGKRDREGRLQNRHFATPEAIRRYAEKIMENYSQDPRNIGNLPDAPLVGIMSPPYQDTAMPMGCPAHIRKLAREGRWDEAIELEKKAEAFQAKKGNKFAVSTDETIRKKIEMALEREKGNYSENPDNIGNLKDVPLVGIMSPPYQDSLCSGKLSHEDAKKMAMAMYEKHGRTFSEKDLEHQIKLLQDRSGKGYSLDPNNIGNLKDVPLVGIMSPPFLEAQTGGGIAIRGYEGKYYYDQGNPDRVGERCGYVKARQGTSEGQIGNLPDKPLVGITSPPYGLGGGGLGNDGRQTQVQKDKNIHLHYSESETNIGNLTDKPLVGITSPPYNTDSQHSLANTAEIRDRKRGYEGDFGFRGQYSQGENNIGNQEGESYLSAMFKVYQQAFICGISPLVVVTKNPTRNGKLRRLDLDTIFLLQACGYEIFDYHRSILFESHKQETLSGDTKDVHKGRISFFKRLSLEKGTTVAQWEDIIFARIPIKMRVSKSGNARAQNKPGAPDSGG